MILIADSGATKTEWACVNPDASGRISFFSQGYNPNFISGAEIIEDIRGNLPEGFNPDCVKEIYFYGAGVTELQYPFMERCLRTVFKEAETVFIAMDLLAAARSLLQHEAGFAAILGTGTNSCTYDGQVETLNIDSVGFIVGDEGSGGYLGKCLVRDFIRGNMPPKEHDRFAELVKMNNDELIDTIYTKPFPNRFCAQFSKFIHDNLNTDPYYYNLVENSFRDFFREIVSHYPDYQKYSFNCVGSVGYYYRDILEKVAAEYGMTMGTILKAPMEGLIKFHTNAS